MSVQSVRNVLPAVASMVATLFLATAVPRGLVVDAANVAPVSVAQAEVQRCEANGRDTDACLDEADAKALIEQADRLARNDDASRRGSR